MYNVGDEVRWTSQAGGRVVEKVGKVVAVLLPGENAGKYSRYSTPHPLIMLDPEYRLRDCYSRSARKETSYLVQVGGRKRDLYWPLTKYLQLTKPAPLELKVGEPV